MELKQAIEILKNHNVWRRYDGKIKDSPKIANPTELGIAIDVVVKEFEK